MNYYYNVIIFDYYPNPENQLVFTFYSLEEALEYVEKILVNSHYYVSVLKLEDKYNG